MPWDPDSEETGKGDCRLVTWPSTMPDLTSRAQGAFLGLAAGNALGLPFESMWPASKIGDATRGRIREIPSSAATDPWDDETAHAILIAQALSETGDTDPSDLVQRLLQWRDSNGRGMGVLLEKLLEEVEGEVAVLEASEELCERLGRNWSAGNDPLIRAVPIAIAARKDRVRLARLARDAARTTHWNPLCVGSTVAFALALADTLDGKACDLPELAAEMALMEFPEQVSQAVSGARLPLSTFQLDGKQKGYAIKALQVGLWALRTEGTMEELLEQVILQGGDTDTNAAIAGAAIGMRLGVEAIPERWISGLREPELLRKTALSLIG